TCGGRTSLLCFKFQKINFLLLTFISSKTEIEGPMLVYRRADRPTHSFIIANRHSRQDFIEPISPTLQLCLKSSYIMMNKPEDKEIFGIWICDTTDCERIYKLLQNLVAECAKSPPQMKASSESPNLLDLLSHSPEGQDSARNHSSTRVARSADVVLFRSCSLFLS
ncbi:unnamed protein product, partial [Enterobius vermicularis]|uniref:mRNA-decapping enzyme 1B n=1 Tax=Enterobius vermicularis TaxID=51028 RepID=A0A0N4V9M1_ENTVE